MVVLNTGTKSCARGVKLGGSHGVTTRLINTPKTIMAGQLLRRSLFGGELNHDVLDLLPSGKHVR